MNHWLSVEYLFYGVCFMSCYQTLLFTQYLYFFLHWEDIIYEYLDYFNMFNKLNYILLSLFFESDVFVYRILRFAILLRKIRIRFSFNRNVYFSWHYALYFKGKVNFWFGIFLLIDTWWIFIKIEAIFNFECFIMSSLLRYFPYLRGASSRH